MDLYEWTKHYISFRDCIKKQIVKQEFEEDSVLVEEKKGNKEYYINQDLGKLIPKIKDGIKTFLVCENTEKNIHILVKEWDELIKNKEITIIFANAKTNQSWLINPRLHSHISERDKLKEGLISLCNGITRVD